MSHVASVKCTILDLDALAEAAKKKGGVLVRDQQSFKMWGSQRQPCIHAIKLENDPHAYEVGLRYRTTNPAEGYDLHCDFYDGKLSQAFGQELLGLRNEYTALVAEKALKQQGWFTRRTEDTAQRVQVYAYR